MISQYYGDISRCKADAIVNAANGLGFMGGKLGRMIRFRGVAESLHYASEGLIEKEATAICRKRKIDLGDVFVTSAYSLPATYIFHAVTMRKPGQKSTMETIKKCLQNLLKTTIELQVSSVAVPLLGTGVGGLNKNEVQDLIYKELAQSDEVEWIIVAPK
ncbi:macro domain-containing protein [Brevibacillus marinus]|uniref:macro domain-containing protein n=1 Tax=Brevibacillus marinus TaxID=2496837 RepID=UPI000F819461|nr:macro domain-containing protein [Brevibacillus marinus]